MPKMYELEYGEEWVNLDRVDQIKLRSRKDENGVRVHVAYFYRAGEVVAQHETYGIAPAFTEKTDLIIPAAPGHEVLLLNADTWDEETRQNKRPVSVTVDRHAVVAWRITQGDESDEPYAVPVIAAHAHADVRLVPTIDGKFEEPRYEGACFDSLDDAKRAVLERAQGDYDSKRQPKSAAA